MAIQPIDLQTLFTQIDKVAKNQAMMRDGQQVQNTLQQAEIQRKLQENVQSVNQSQNMGDESGKIKDEDKRGGAFAKGGKHEEEPEAEEDEAAAAAAKDKLIRDPALGRNIDLSG